LIPEDISTYGHEVDFLFYLILGITTVTLIGVLALMVYFLVRYRSRPGARAVFSHGSKRLEVTWTTATAAILVFIALAQKRAWTHIKQELPPEAESYLVRVFGEQFEWTFVHPGPDGTFEPNRLQDVFPGDNPVGLRDPAKDVVRKELVVPVNTKVLLDLNSLGKFDQSTQKETPGVLHSLFAPNLRLKQDVVPGLTQRIWFEATKTGTYEIACAELCGLGHYKMRATLRVLTDAEVNQAIGYDWKATKARFSPAE
jgi:cytochrome c oxidase subunit 2